jgi:hypothetical protein
MPTQGAWSVHDAAWEAALTEQAPHEFALGKAVRKQQATRAGRIPTPAAPAPSMRRRPHMWAVTAKTPREDVARTACDILMHAACMRTLHA